MSPLADVVHAGIMVCGRAWVQPIRKATGTPDHAEGRAGRAVPAPGPIMVVASTVARPGGRGEPDRQALWSPCSGRGVEHAGHGRVTVRAPAVGGEPVGAQAVPVAFDHNLAAVVAVGALACGVVDVAGVGSLAVTVTFMILSLPDMPRAGTQQAPAQVLSLGLVAYVVT